MNQVKLLRELTFRERTMKDFEELRKLCCADNPGAFEVSATSNGFEKNTKRGVSFVAPGAKDSITKLKKRKEVLCENSSAGSEGQNGDSTEGTYPDIEKKGQKSFTLKKKKAVLEKRQAKANVDEGYITKPENVSDEDKAKRKAKCVGGMTKTNKAISTLSDIQYEKIFQSVIDKSLEECIGMASSVGYYEINEVSTVGRRHKRKGQPKKIVQDYTKFIDDDEESALDNYVAWVQCSEEKCGKWRRLDDSVDPATLPDDWVCSQNPDPLYNMCDLPEEVWDGRENDIIYAELVPGSIVWAKQLGYPWWPGMVEHDPQTGKYFMFTTDSDQFPVSMRQRSSTILLSSVALSDSHQRCLRHLLESVVDVAIKTHWHTAADLRQKCQCGNTVVCRSGRQLETWGHFCCWEALALIDRHDDARPPLLEASVVLNFGDLEQHDGSASSCMETLPLTKTNWPFFLREHDTMSTSECERGVISASECEPGVISASECEPAVISASECKPGVISASECEPGVISASESESGVISASECEPAVISASECEPGVISASECESGVISASECEPAVISASECEPGVISASECKPGVISASECERGVISASECERGKRDFSKRVNTAKKMAEEAQKVKIQDRISQFGFLVRYKGIEDAKLSEDSPSQESLEDPCIVEDAKRPKSRNKEESWSKDCAEKEPETHQLRARKGKEKNGGVHLAAGPRKPSKRESPAHLVRKTLPNNSKWFRDPTLKRDSSGGNQEVAEKSAASNGIEELELMPQRAKGTEDKVTGHDRIRRKACLSPDPDSHTLPRIAADLNEKESTMAKKHLLREPPSPPRGGPASEGFTKLLQEVVEKKQDADSFSDNDMAILTLKKSEDEEEFADFMFEE
ncbi:uncharacterized protein LOC109935863 [Rhincodon typus]|uniref:uncharacterized protein LOC109935863 n=1 Tax=Rhincodon typus TaxID=259920 RepID=UPI00202F1532|nr:uncharacterized protein LOC109935863 [Rhincodon typus]